MNKSQSQNVFWIFLSYNIHLLIQFRVFLPNEMTEFPLLHILQLVKSLSHLKNEKRYAFSGATAPYIYYREYPLTPGAEKRTSYDQPWPKKHELSKVAYTVSTSSIID